MSEPGDETQEERPEAAEPVSAGGRGTIRRQDAASARPRQPTVAEARHREKVRKAREVAERFAREQELQREKRAATRRKALMGSVAVVGLVGVVALGYHVLNDDDDEVSATCVREGTNEVVSDNYCAGGSPGVGGLFIFAGSPYRYYYGGTNGGVGSVARGGTLELPRGTTAKTNSGTSVTRGGFGSGSSAGTSSGS